MAHFLLRQQPTDERLKFSSKFKTACLKRQAMMHTAVPELWNFSYVTFNLNKDYTVDELKKKIFDIASPIIGPVPPRVLFIGESGAGKSSFISSILSTFNGIITMPSTIGYRVGYEFNNSRRFFEYRIHEKDAAGRTLNLILCDSRGISKDGQLGISKREIPLLIEGRFRHGDKIRDDYDPSHDTEIAQREPIEPSCIVFLEKAVRIGDAHDSIKDKLNLARDLIREKGIPSCLVITHIDEVEPNLKNVLRSKKIEKLIKERAGEAGVTTNRVFVVKNYTDERRTHVKHDVFILRTVLSIVSDVNQRLRDKRVEDRLALPITSRHALLHQSPANNERTSSVASDYDDYFNITVQPEDSTSSVASDYDDYFNITVQPEDREMAQTTQPSVIYRLPLNSKDLSRTRNDLYLSPNRIQPKPAPRRIQRLKSEIDQSNKGAISKTSQISGSYDALETVDQSTKSIRNSPLKEQGSTSDIQYEESFRHTQLNSSDEEEEEPKSTTRPRHGNVQKYFHERLRTKSEMKERLSFTFNMPNEDS